MISVADVRKAMAIAGSSPEARAYFFDRIQKPEWIRPLVEAGAFREPPSAITDGTYISWPLWPASRYLVRMARVPDAHAAVLEAAAAIPPTNNIRVQEDLSEIALRLPAHMAAQLSSQARQWLETPGHFDLPLKLGSLVTHLLAHEEREHGLELLRSVLAVRSGAIVEGEEDAFGLPPDPKGYCDDYWYSEIIKSRVTEWVAAAGFDVFNALSTLLAESIRLSVTGGDLGAPEDHSQVWYRAIEHTSRSGEGIREALVAGVRDAAAGVLEEDGKALRRVVNHLEAEAWHAHRRIALFLIRTCPNADIDIVEARLVDRHLLGGDWCYHEYFLLTKDRYQNLSPEGKAQILEWIDEGPTWLNEALRTGANEGQAEDAEAVADAMRAAEEWRLRRLTPLDGHLDEAWQERLAILRRKFAGLEAIDFSTPYPRTWVGPTSPKSSEDLSRLTIDELVTYLRTWKPDEGPTSPSAEGLGRILSGRVASDPGPFALEAMKFQVLDPTYVRSILEGLRSAAREGRQFDWAGPLELSQWVVNQPADTRQEDVSLQRDTGWRWTRMTIADLVDAGFDPQSQAIPHSLRERAWGVLGPLTEDPDPMPREETPDNESGMDPATLAINTTRGKAMHAVIRYALWIRNANDLRPDGKDLASMGFKLFPEVRSVLESHLDPAKDPSPAIRSVYGQWFPWIALLDSSWAKGHVRQIFPPDCERLWTAAWDTYIVFCEPFSAVFDLLVGEYRRAVLRTAVPRGQQRGGYDADDHLGQHLLTLHWRGKLDGPESKDLLDLFFAKAPIAKRQIAMGFVGWVLSKGSADREPLQRLASFFDRRLASVRESAMANPAESEELVPFGTWVSAGRFDPPWALDRLASVLALSGKVIHEHQVVEYLAKVASTHSELVAKCLSLLVENTKESFRVDFWGASIRVALLALRENGNKATRAKVDAMVERLLALGRREFRDLARSQPPS